MKALLIGVMIVLLVPRAIADWSEGQKAEAYDLMKAVEADKVDSSRWVTYYRDVFLKVLLVQAGDYVIKPTTIWSSSDPDERNDFAVVDQSGNPAVYGTIVRSATPSAAIQQVFRRIVSFNRDLDFLKRMTAINSEDVGNLCVILKLPDPNRGNEYSEFPGHLFFVRGNVSFELRAADQKSPVKPLAKIIDEALVVAVERPTVPAPPKRTP